MKCITSLMLWVVVMVVARGGGTKHAFAETFTVPWSVLNFTIPSNTTFAVGDQLIFPYNQGAEDLAEVTKDDYLTCNGKSPINRWINGNTSVTLQSAGAKYFISSFPGHCPPLKLTITVVGPTNYSDSSIDTTIANLHAIPTNNRNGIASNVKNDAFLTARLYSSHMLIGTITTYLFFSLV